MRSRRRKRHAMLMSSRPVHTVPSSDSGLEGRLAILVCARTPLSHWLSCRLAGIEGAETKHEGWTGRGGAGQVWFAAYS